MHALSRLTQQLLQPQLVQQRLWGGEHRLQGANAQDERLQGRDGAAPVLDLDTVAPQERWLRICLMMQIRHLGDRHQSNGALGSDGHRPWCKAQSYAAVACSTRAACFTVAFLSAVSDGLVIANPQHAVLGSGVLR